MDNPLSPIVAKAHGSHAALRVGAVPGLTPDKWVRRWQERVAGVPITVTVDDDPVAGLARSAGSPGFDVVFFRELAAAPRSAPPGLLRIPLYTEAMAVLAAKGHEITAFESVCLAELEGERWSDAVDPLATTRSQVEAAVDLVAANVGLLLLPMPYARSLGRKDVVVRPLAEDAEAPSVTRMGIAWACEREGEQTIEDFVGIVRGRTERSSR